MKALLQMLRRRAQTLALWQGLFVAAVIWGFVNGHLAEQTAVQRMRFVAMDSRDTFYLSAAGSFEEANRIRVEIAKLAAETIFDRSPDGFTDPERLERLFSPLMTAQLQKDAARDDSVFKQQQVHQSVETGQIRELSIDDNTALVSVECEVLRVGVFNSKTVNNSRKATVFLRLALNDDIAHNGRYPLVVTDYQERFE